MDKLQAVVSSKGQVTIPAEVREALDLQQGDIVDFHLPANGEGEVTVRRASGNRQSVVDRVFGALRSELPMLDPAEEKLAFERGVAETVEPEPPARPTD
jgi:AbrB family looped-hinge helix DNA binding protein